MMRQVRVRHPALVARIITAGVSVAATFGIVAAIARDGQRSPSHDPERLVEVRIGPGVDDGDARAALRAWIEGRPDLTRDASLFFVDDPADTETGPS